VKRRCRMRHSGPRHCVRTCRFDSQSTSLRTPASSRGGAHRYSDRIAGFRSSGPGQSDRRKACEPISRPMVLPRESAAVSLKYRRWDLNPHTPLPGPDFESDATAIYVVMEMKQIVSGRRTRALASLRAASAFRIQPHSFYVINHTERLRPHRTTATTSGAVCQGIALRIKLALCMRRPDLTSKGDTPSASSQCSLTGRSGVLRSCQKTGHDIQAPAQQLAWARRTPP
jgi:hypothetical protein